MSKNLYKTRDSLMEKINLSPSSPSKSHHLPPSKSHDIKPYSYPVLYQILSVRRFNLFIANMSSSNNYSQGGSQNYSQQYQQSYSQSRTRVAQRYGNTSMFLPAKTCPFHIPPPPPPTPIFHPSIPPTPLSPNPANLPLSASGPTSAATYPATAATHPATGAATQPRPAYQYPRSLTPSLQQIPTGQTPMQYYAGRVQAFEQVPLGHPTSRKNMEAHVQTIMRRFEGGGR